MPGKIKASEAANISRVTRCVREKNAVNVAKHICGKSIPKIRARYFCNFHKTTQSRLKFDQFGHPEYHPWGS
jgi:hypothetical protein